MGLNKVGRAFSLASSCLHVTVPLRLWLRLRGGWYELQPEGGWPWPGAKHSRPPFRCYRRDRQSHGERSRSQLLFKYTTTMTTCTTIRRRRQLLFKLGGTTGSTEKKINFGWQIKFVNVYFLLQKMDLFFVARFSLLVFSRWISDFPFLDFPFFHFWFLSCCIVNF